MGQFDTRAVLSAGEPPADLFGQVESAANALVARSERRRFAA